MSNFGFTSCLHNVVSSNNLLQSLKIYLLLSFLCCYVESCVEIFGDSIHLRTGLQEEHDNVNIAKSRGDVKGSLLLLKKYNIKKIKYDQSHNYWEIEEVWKFIFIILKTKRLLGDIDMEASKCLRILIFYMLHLVIVWMDI